jgi:hypothetical protein
MQFIFCIVQYYQLHSNNFLDLKDAIFVDVKQDDECMFFFFSITKINEERRVIYYNISSNTLIFR